MAARYPVHPAKARFRDLNQARSNTPHAQALSTLPDYVLYRHASLVFSANALSKHRHSIDSFHQPHAEAKESTVNCISTTK
jgi:hypothetical protein